MNFSSQELYFMYGQYDTFVMLEFHPETKSYSIFGGSCLMGRFKYTRYEKIRFEKLRGCDVIPRTEELVKFFPSKKSDFTEEIQILLDRDGILCSDISGINSLNLERENRFTIKGKKEIPNKLTIEYKEEGQEEEDLFTIGFYKNRLKNGYKLPYFEFDELRGLLLFYRPEEVIDNPRLYKDKEKTNLRDEVMMHYLNCKQNHKKATEEDVKEMDKLMTDKFNKHESIIVDQIKKNGVQINRIRDLEEKDFSKAIVLSSIIDDDTILPYPHPIWCDFESLAHIYLGHVQEFYIGKPGSRNTFFQYNTKEVRNIIGNVMEMVYEEFLQAITNNPNKNWGRRGPRAIEYDGHYYRIEIEPNGRLFTFHPYDNFEEAKKDI